MGAGAAVATQSEESLAVYALPSEAGYVIHQTITSAATILTVPQITCHGIASATVAGQAYGIAFSGAARRRPRPAPGPWAGVVVRALCYGPVAHYQAYLIRPGPSSTGSHATGSHVSEIYSRVAMTVRHGDVLELRAKVTSAYSQLALENLHTHSHGLAEGAGFTPVRTSVRASAITSNGAGKALGPGTITGPPTHTDLPGPVAATPALFADVLIDGRPLSQAPRLGVELWVSQTGSRRILAEPTSNGTIQHPDGFFLLANVQRGGALKLGLHIGYSGHGLDSKDQLAIVKEAEWLGYDSVWVAEAYGSDGASVLGWLAGQTERIRLGSAVFQMPARSPAMTAMTAATIDLLSGGRMILGIGPSGPQVAEGWHGQRFANQLQRTREYVAVLRMVLARERLSYLGETLELPLPPAPGQSERLGKVLRLTISPVQERIPIYIAAIGPRSSALAAEIADGFIPTLFSPAHLARLRPVLEEGAARAGRTLADFDISPVVNVLISDDHERARDVIRPIIALYVGGMGSRRQNFYNRLVRGYGYEAQAALIQDLYLSGRHEEAVRAVPDELIDAVSLCGPAALVREQLQRYRAADVGTLGITPLGTDVSERLEQLRLVAELTG